MFTVTKLENPIDFIIDETVVKIKKIEVNHYKVCSVVNSVRFCDIDPWISINNIIRNVALMSHASFIEKDAKTVLARIQDVNGSTLIRTEWEISTDVFNEVATLLQYNKGIPEYKFHVISKVS